MPQNCPQELSGAPREGSPGPLGRSWVTLGAPSGALERSRGALGTLLERFWPLLAALGRAFSTLLAQKAARQRQGAPRQPQKSPKRPPRELKWFPKSANFMYLLGSFFELSSGLLFGRILGRLALKICDFAWEVLQKRCFPQVTSKSEQKTEKVTKEGSKK